MYDIDSIVRKEWEMFRAVNGDGPKASCQNDPGTFYAMRRGQFTPWSDEALRSYEADLDEAIAAGRNLPEEKYIRMMEHTEPEDYEALRHRLPPADPEQLRLARALNERLLAQAATMRKAHPFLDIIGRPLYSEGDGRYDTSVETYQLGELMGYSARTLALLTEHLGALEARGISLAEEMQLASLRMSGFPDFESAERAVTGK